MRKLKRYRVFFETNPLTFQSDLTSLMFCSGHQGCWRQGCRHMACGVMSLESINDRSIMTEYRLICWYLLESRQSTCGRSFPIIHFHIQFRIHAWWILNCSRVSSWVVSVKFRLGLVIIMHTRTNSNFEYIIFTYKSYKCYGWNISHLIAYQLIYTPSSGFLENENPEL